MHTGDTEGRRTEPRSSGENHIRAYIIDHPFKHLKIMAGKKREREDSEVTKKPKKIKFDNGAATSKPAAEEIDFPRGGGTVLTPLEYKNIQNEAAKEADMELVFEVGLII